MLVYKEYEGGIGDLTRKSGDSIASISGLSQKEFKAAKQPGGFVTNKKLWYNIDDKPINKQVNGRTRLTA